MRQVRKFDGGKGSKKKLAWTTQVEEAFERLKRALLKMFGLFLINLDKAFVLPPMLRIVPWEQSWSRSGRMVPMSQWSPGVQLWQG